MRVLQGILLSLFLHFLFVWLAQFAPLLQSRPEENKAISVDIIEDKKSHSDTEKQIVRDAMVPDKIKEEENDDPLKFLSARTQRVKKQTQALLNGMTANRSQSEKRKSEKQQQEQAKKPDIDPRLQGNMDAYAPNYRKAPSLPQESQMDKGMSTLGEALPTEVEVGSFTALNTDRYLYYSFYARIEELIRFRWESAVRNSIDSTPPERFVYNASGQWTTNVEIWLKPNGEFHSAHIMKESGFRNFDSDAVQAFVQARVFPNPPKEMVESDGLIHLKYGFQVRYAPKVIGKANN